MKLEHLMQAYKHNGIEPIEVKRVEEERSGVIKFTDDIYATYYEDDEVVRSIQIFATALTSKAKTASNQVIHTTELLKVLSHTIDLLANTTQKERNDILKSLGLFNGAFKEGKYIQYQTHMYKIEIVESLILFTLSEVEVIE